MFAGDPVADWKESIMDNRPTRREQRMRALIAVARMELDPKPETWPVAQLDSEGFAAAAIVTDRMDLLSERCTDPASLWFTLSDPFRAVVKQRNPAMAAYCAYAAKNA